MIKDTFFSMPRFVNYCRKDVAENWKLSLLRIVLMYGVMAVWMILNTFSYYSAGATGTSDYAWYLLQLVFVGGLFGFGCLSASFTMEKMKSQARRTALLLIPATPFEKFFSRWLFSTLLFLPLFAVSYKLADYTRVWVISMQYPDVSQIAPIAWSNFVHNNATSHAFFESLTLLWTVVALYFFVQSCFLLGSTIWPKGAFLKTFAAGFLLVITYGMVVKIVFEAIHQGTPNAVFVDPYPAVVIIAPFLALLNWVLAYYRFKEADIIN